MIRYIHETSVHNTNASSQVVPELIRRFKPTSVVDVGCGTATWLAVFKKLGVQTYLGIDGDYVNRELLMIEQENFLPIDLNSKFEVHKKFDLVICLEVAEHLEPSIAVTFIESLTRLGDIIVFSAAIPGQGGQNHINEQYPDYWINIFSTFGFYLTEDIRTKFWNNSKVDWWYRQNMLILKKDKSSDYENLFQIHPELYIKKLNEITNLENIVSTYSSGKISPIKAMKILAKSILYNFGYKKNMNS